MHLSRYLLLFATYQDHFLFQKSIFNVFLSQFLTEMHRFEVKNLENSLQTNLVFSSNFQFSMKVYQVEIINLKNLLEKVISTQFQVITLKIRIDIQILHCQINWHCFLLKI